MTTLAELVVQETKAVLFAKALEVATTVGLPVTTWQEGEPTRTLMDWASDTLATLEGVAARYVASGFLDLAARLTDTQWLILLAEQQYGYTARAASYATCTVRLTNGGGGVYTIDAQSLTFAKATEPEVTYRNTSGGSLLIGPGSTLDVDVECETAGSTGSASIGELELVTVLGAGTVTATNTTAAVGIDDETVTSIVAGCRAKLASLSGMGPAGIYAYVALASDLTGTTNVTRVRVYPDSTTGEVDIYIAGAATLSAADRRAVEEAILEWATPLCITPSVTAAGATAVNITATVYAYDSINATETEIQEAVEDAIDTMLANLPIGGDGEDGKLYRAKLISTIKGTYPEIFDVLLTAPAVDVNLNSDRVATKGTVTITADLQAAP